MTNCCRRQLENIEGMACIRTRSGELLLLLARRGGTEQGKLSPPVLVWGFFRISTAEPFVKLGSTAITRNPHHLKSDRGCSDLFLEQARAGSWGVMCAATTDAGDQGPFRSVIYRAGKLKWDDDRAVRFTQDFSILRTIEGLKVEALALPPGAIPASALTIGTDDEAYGGVFRPLFSRDP